MTKQRTSTFRLIIVTTLIVALFLTTIEVAFAAPKFIATTKTTDLNAVNLAKGTTLKITPRFMEKGDKVKSYKSSNTKIVTVDKTGKMKGKKIGKATITVTTKKGYKDTIKINVVSKKKNAKSIKLPTSKTLKLNSVSRLAVTISPTSATNVLKWSSSNKSVATVDTAGYITAKKPGTAKITVTTTNFKRSTCTITVKDYVTISAITKTITAGNTDTLTATALSGSVIWNSSDNSIATVNNNGKIKAVKPGTVTITATSVNKATAKCTVTVTAAPKAVDSSNADHIIFAGKMKTLKATISDGSGDSTITWSSSNTAVAKVSAKGTVTGIGYGIATITAKTKKGKKQETKVLVRNLEPTSTSTVVLTPGVTFKGFNIFGTPSVTMTSSNSKIKIDSSGLITVNTRSAKGKKYSQQSATLTATSSKGETATLKIKVVDRPTIVDLSAWQDKIDWSKASKSIDFAILKATEGDYWIDNWYQTYSAACITNGVPYGAYHFARYGKDKKLAAKEAKYFFKNATKSGKMPTVFVLDVEVGNETKAATEEFIKVLRSEATKAKLPGIKVGVYIAHHLHNTLNLNLTYNAKKANTPDFVWIPRYSYADNGSITGPYSPQHYCDLWQFSSGGGIPGINGRVDMNSLVDEEGNTLTKNSFFNLEWLTTGGPNNG